MNARPERTGRRLASEVLPPDIDKLPEAALLTRAQLVALTGFTDQAFRKWAHEGRGPAITYVEGRPRTTVRDFKAWVAGTAAPRARSAFA